MLPFSVSAYSPNWAILIVEALAVLALIRIILAVLLSSSNDNSWIWLRIGIESSDRGIEPSLAKIFESFKYPCTAGVY